MTWQSRNSTVPMRATPQDDLRPLYGEVVHRVEAAATIPVRHAVGVFVAVALVVGSFSMWMAWIGWFWPTFFFSALLSTFVYLLELWRWNVMRERIASGDFNQNGVPDLQEGRVLVFKIERPDGRTSVLRTDISTDDQAAIMNVARAFVAGRPTTQTAMSKNHRIGRKKLEKIMDMFLELRIIEKAGDKPNDPYEVADSPDAKQVMGDLAYGRFETLKEVWE